jgi:sulfide:quinone oxidoreductase
MTHVVVLGAGIAGVPAAYALKSRLSAHDQVTVVSDKDYFHFVPSNPWIAMGWRDRADIAFPIAPYLNERGIRFVCSALKGISPDRNEIALENGQTLAYDFLLIATGVEGNFDELSGLAAHTHSVLHIEQAEKAHAAYKEFVKNPGPIVVGAMQGSSVLGPVYEYAFLADADLKRRNIRGRVPITLVTPEPWPGHLGLGASGGTNREAVQAALADTHINIICNARTLRIEADTIHVAELDDAGSEKKLHELPYAYAVYWPSFRGVAGVRSASALVNKKGLVEVDEYMRNRGYHNVYATGVCVAHSVVDRTPLEVGAPDSVYSIQKETETAVFNIVASIRGEAIVSNIPQRARWLSDMGETGAAYLSGPQVPLRDINWMRQGRWVHLAKVDFEKYFINRVRLKPAAQAPSVASKIADIMSLVLAQKIEGLAPIAATASPGAQLLEVHLSRDAQFELRALAKSVGRDPDLLGTELLSAAITEAKSFLNEAGVNALERARRELLVDELPERQPGVEFHGGGT